jgi:hypothetical protein
MQASPFVAAALLTVFFAQVGCASSSSSALDEVPVIDAVDVSGAALKAADGNYDLTLRVTAHDGVYFTSARVDFPSSEPANLVGTEVALSPQTLSSTGLSFRLAAAAGPGTGDANLVLTDEKARVVKKKIVVTLSP